jgi:hypothetical protein
VDNMKEASPCCHPRLVRGDEGNRESQKCERRKDKTRQVTSAAAAAARRNRWLRERELGSRKARIIPRVWTGRPRGAETIETDDVAVGIVISRFHANPTVHAFVFASVRVLQCYLRSHPPAGRGAFLVIGRATCVSKFGVRTPGEERQNHGRQVNL